MSPKVIKYFNNLCKYFFDLQDENVSIENIDLNFSQISKICWKEMNIEEQNEAEKILDLNRQKCEEYFFLVMNKRNKNSKKYSKEELNKIVNLFQDFK